MVQTALAIFCSGPPNGLEETKIAEVPKVPDIAQAGPTVPVSPEVAAVVTGEGPTNEVEVKEAPSVRMKKYLLARKASKTTCTQESKAEKAEPVQSLEVKKSQDHPATKFLPPKPSDWVQDQTPVSAEQQVVPKPRGRKKKVVDTEQASTETPASAAPKPKAAAKRKGKAKVNAEEKAPATSSRSSKRKPAEHTPQEYEPLEVEGEVGMDKPKAFDNYAAACAKADIHKLLHGTEALADPETKPKKRDSAPITTQPKKRAKKAPTDSSSKRDDTTAEDIKEQETKERKARLSRKSVAYKREYNKQIRAGSKEEVARAAAKKAS